MTTDESPNPRVTLRNEEILTDLLTHILLTGTPDEEQIRLMGEFVKLAHDDPDLFIHLKPADAKQQAIAAYERCLAVLRDHRQDLARDTDLMNHPAWR